MLQSMGCQKVRHNLVTEQQQQWLETKETFSHRSGDQKSITKLLGGHTSSRGSRDKFFSCLLLCGSITPVSAFNFTWSSLLSVSSSLPVGIFALGSRIHFINPGGSHLEILHLITTHIFQNKFTFTGTLGLECGHTFLVAQFNPL